MTLVTLAVSLVVILAAAFIFTNAVEIAGERLNLGAGAVGSVLAAVGTALPETMIPVVAIVGALFSSGSAGGEIGVGAILGAPFLLATLAMFVVGASALGFRGRRDAGEEVEVDKANARRDLVSFLALFVLGAGVGILGAPFFVKIGVAVVLLGGYALYVRRTLKSGGELEDVPEKLWLWPFGAEPPRWAVFGQLLFALALIVGGAHFFVTSIEHLSRTLGVPAGLIALVLAPLATELPEKFNSILWLRDGKDTLALGNITGAMVFQSTVPVVLGVLFTDWNIDPLGTFSVALALAGGALLLALLLLGRPIRGRQLLVGGALYAAFVVAALFTIL